MLGRRVVTGSMKAQLGRFFARAAVAPEERGLAGTVSGVLWLLGGLTLVLLAALPGIPHSHLLTLAILAAAATSWGTCSLVFVEWDGAPAWLIHTSATAGFGVIAAAVASTGGADSPAWIYLFFIAVFAAYFFGRAVATLYLTACVGTHAVPLLYDSRAPHSAFLAQLLIGGVAYLALGEAIVSGKELMWRLRTRAEELATEQGSLRRVATAVVSGDGPERIYELVAREAAAMLEAGAAGILRLDRNKVATVMGSWADHPGGRYEPGTAVPVRPGSDVERAIESGLPVRIDDHTPNSPVGRLGYSASIVAPVRVAGEIWGVLAVTAAQPARLTAQDEQRLMTFGDLLATVIASIEDRAKLAAQASTDPLTGLANHRTLQERLSAEVSRALRHDRILSVAVIDIDHFKQINDVAGHEAGDETLVRVARCLRKLARAEDTLGRAGGDEFAWILPETTREEARMAVERARRVINQAGGRSFRITVSAGVCDTRATSDPTELLHLADGALYWSKAHGRNQCWIYDPEVVNELSAEERAQRLERSQALAGLRGLARAIDAKDAATREHSERVAALAAKLARAAGWSHDRSLLLSEAALVHDVGKIGVPDALLRKLDPLTPAEREQLNAHAELSARILEGVLSAEQVEWVRRHHERPDGRGYPDRLAGSRIPEGAALLAVADAWDVMTVSRPYSTPKSAEQALDETKRLVGKQFSEIAVLALVKLHESGELKDESPLRAAAVTR